jgi:hypothetical protein
MKKTIDYTDAELQHGIELAKVQMDELYAERETWDKKWSAVRSEQERFMKEKARRAHEVMLASNTTDWALLLTYEPYESYYKLLNDELLKRSPDQSIAQEGYSPDAMQYMLKLKFTRGDVEQVAKAAELIKEILPVMKVTEIEQGYITFSIFDRGLSEYETYCMVYKPEAKHWFVGTHRAYTGRRDWEHGPFDNLEDALTVVSNNYWYELPNGEQDEDE